MSEELKEIYKLAEEIEHELTPVIMDITRMANKIERASIEAPLWRRSEAIKFRRIRMMVKRAWRIAIKLRDTIKEIKTMSTT